MKNASRQRSAPSTFQHRLSLSLLALLVFIGGGILWLQKSYDPTSWRLQSGPATGRPHGREDLPKDLVSLSPAECYNAENLSDKINGKAELYLGAGFKGLEAGRLGVKADPGSWMERYVYDMGEHRNAFSVFSVQRRGDARPVDISDHAYLSSNGLFLVHGPYYLEIVASEASPLIQSHMTALGAAFVASHPVETVTLAELNLLPPDQLVPNTPKLIAESAFGIQGLDWIYTARYATEKARALAFIARRPTHGEARASAEAFIGFWKDYGGEDVQPTDRFKGASIVLILDNHEIAMVQGPYLFGVHEANSLQFGLDVMERLRRAVGEVSP